MRQNSKSSLPVSNFLQLSFALMGEAKLYLLFSIIFGVLTTIIGVLISFLSSEWRNEWGLGAAALSSLFAIVSFVFFRKYEGKYDLASEAKRFALFENGLGWVIPVKVLTDINNRAGERASKAGTLIEVSEYYASTKNSGPSRLLDHLLESAFFTFNLYRTLQEILGVVIIILFGAVAVIGWAYLVSPETQDFRVMIGQFIVVLIPAILSIGLVSSWFKLRDLSHYIELIFIEAEGMRRPTEREVVRLVSEYNCRIAQGLPIPGLLYNHRRNYLNKLWAQRKRRAQR